MREQVNDYEYDEDDEYGPHDCDEDNLVEDEGTGDHERLEAFLASFRAGMHRNSKGNLTTTLHGKCWTVFRRFEGFRYSIANERDPVRYSTSYEDEDEALSMLGSVAYEIACCEDREVA
jgi:hypothetical protein